jgi:hypothetical protein
MENDIKELDIRNVKVSSTLFNNTTEYGKQLMFDNKEDTCWNSAEGSLQYIFIILNEFCEINKIELICQGGFCPRVYKILTF